MKNKFAITALTIAMSVSTAVPALAQFTRASETTLRGVRRDVQDTTSEVRNLRNDVRTQSRILMEALRMQTGEQSAYADKQIESFKRIEDAAQQNATDRMRQQVRATAESGEFDPNPDACLLLDLFGSDDVEPSGAQGTRTMVAAQAERERIGSLGAAGAIREMLDKEVIIDGHDATKRASTFLEMPTFDMNDADNSEAAEAFMLKMFSSIPIPPVPEELRNTSPHTERAAAIETRMNRESIAAENIAMVFNMGAAVVSGAELQKLAAGTPYNRPIPANASELQAIDVMTVRHYSPPPGEAGKTVQTGVVLQKLHQLTAIMARMQYMQLEMDRRNLMTQSAILAKMIENDGRP